MINPNGHTEIGLWHFDILKDGFEKFPNGNIERINAADIVVIPGVGIDLSNLV